MAFTYTEDKALVEKAKRLEKAGRSTSSLEYKYDMYRNPLRWFFVKEQLRRHYAKYKKYYPVRKEAK